MLNFRKFEQIYESAGDNLSAEEIALLLGTEVNEGVLSSIKNYLSRLVGGKVKKLDNLFQKYKDNQAEYDANFIDANTKKSKALLLFGQVKDNPIEKSKHREMVERSDIELEKAKNLRDKSNKRIDVEAKGLVGGNARLTAYWELKKAKAEEEVGEDSFNLSKGNADEKTVDIMHKKWEESLAKTKALDAEYKKKYEMGVKSDLINKELSPEQIKLIYEPITDAVREEIRKKSTKEQKELRSIIKKYITENRKIKTPEAEKIIKNMMDRIHFIDSISIAPDIITPQSKVELSQEQITKTIDKAEDKAEEKGITSEKEMDDEIQKYFSSKAARALVEDYAGATIPDKAFEYLKNDIINLFGKVVLYYKSQKSEDDFDLDVTKTNLLDFAAKIYKYKKNKDILNKDLPKAELEEKFKEYNK